MQLELGYSGVPGKGKLHSLCPSAALSGQWFLSAAAACLYLAQGGHKQGHMPSHQGT